MQAYDVAVTMVMNIVVRTDDGAEVAEQIAVRLIRSVEEMNSCLNGADYGVNEATEFSISSADESIDVDIIDDEEGADDVDPV